MILIKNLQWDTLTVLPLHSIHLHLGAVHKIRCPWMKAINTALGVPAEWGGGCNQSFTRFNLHIEPHPNTPLHLVPVYPLLSLPSLVLLQVISEFGGFSSSLGTGSLRFLPSSSLKGQCSVYPDQFTVCELPLEASSRWSQFRLSFRNSRQFFLCKRNADIGVRPLAPLMSSLVSDIPAILALRLQFRRLS